MARVVGMGSRVRAEPPDRKVLRAHPVNPALPARLVRPVRCQGQRDRLAPLARPVPLVPPDPAVPLVHPDLQVHQARPPPR